MRQFGVRADASARPVGTNEFAGDFRKNGACCRVDVGIDPYGPHCDCDIEKTPSIRMAFFVYRSHIRRGGRPCPPGKKHF